MRHSLDFSLVDYLIIPYSIHECQKMIKGIRQKFSASRFEFSQHALNVSLIRHLSVSEMREAISHGDVIEDYPQDKYGPGCLIFGQTNSGRSVFDFLEAQ